MELASSISRFAASEAPRFSFVGRRSPSLLAPDKFWPFEVSARRGLNTAKRLERKFGLRKAFKRKLLIKQTKKTDEDFTSARNLAQVGCVDNKHYFFNRLRVIILPHHRHLATQLTDGDALLGTFP